MPPVSKADQSTLRKDVEFVAKDDSEQVATGVVMVPWAVDRQGDWERPETIAEFAAQFEGFMEAGQADGGIMHAVWPSDHTSLERNEVLDEPTDVGGTTVPEGAWVQSWKFNDDELWSLVDDGVLEGYSIGAINVDWATPVDDPDDLPDEVSVPDGQDGPYWELTDGIIREVSAVDIPAVPDALILETKADVEKRLSDHLGNRDGFVDEALQRGHTEEDAERLWDYLNEAAGVEGAGEPGKQAGVLTRAKVAFADKLLGGGEKTTATTKTAESTSSTESKKEGRTLSKANRDSLFATIDSSLDVLQDAGVDHGVTRFTDRDDVDFSLTEHQAREWGDSLDSSKTVSKQDTVGVDVFRVIAAEDDDTDYDGNLLGLGVDFPEHDTFVDWRRDAFPTPLEDAHVSIYGSVDDLQQATGNVIESLGTVESPTDTLANTAQTIRSKAVANSEESATNNATGGDTPDDDGGEKAATNMTDSDNDPENGGKSLAEKNAEQINELTDAVTSLTAALNGEEPEKTVTVEVEGEAVEVPKSDLEAALGKDGGEPDEDVGALKEDVRDLADRLDTITRQSGYSDQLSGSEKDGGEEAESGLNKFAANLS